MGYLISLKLYSVNIPDKQTQKDTEHEQETEMKKLYTILVVMICSLLLMTGCSIDPNKLIAGAINVATTVVKISVKNNRSTRSTRTTPIFKSSKTTKDFKGNNDRYGWTDEAFIPGHGKVPAIYGLQPCKPWGINAVVLPWKKTLSKINSRSYPANRTQCIKYYGPSAKAASLKFVKQRMRVDAMPRRANRNADNTTKHSVAKSQGLMPLIYKGYPSKGTSNYAKLVEYLKDRRTYAGME